jgi:hypothetical protein
MSNGKIYSYLYATQEKTGSLADPASSLVIFFLSIFSV